MVTSRTDRYRVRLGFAPTRRVVFSKEAAGNQKRIIEDWLRSRGIDLVNLDWLNEEGLLYNIQDARKVAERFRREEVDAIFCPHCNFGSEDAVGELARLLRKPLLLWGPRDDAPLPDGSRLRDTQCGLFATSKVLRRFGIPFTYIVNSDINDEIFAKGFENFMAAAGVVKAFRNLRIGQISTRPAAFWSVIANEGELLERFGIQIVPVDLTEIVGRADSKMENNRDEVASVVEGFKAKADCSGVNQDLLQKIAALKLTIQEWASENGCSAIAMQCWSVLPKCFDILPCFIIGELTDDGLPAACETDIHGAITSIMLQAAVRGVTPTFFADLTVRHPENDNGELLWHCGPFPLSLKKENSRASVVGKGLGQCEIRGGDITIARFDGDHGEYSLLMGHVRGIPGPKTTGTYVWVEADDWPKWEKAFIYGPYIHHVAGVHGRVAPVLYEACRYIPGLRPDPIGMKEGHRPHA